jgi:chemotaxis protein MotB
VAYADFVTALMALFIALWVMNSDGDVKKAVSGYFKDPRGYTTRVGAGPAGSGEGLTVTRANMSEIQSEIERALRAAPEFQRIRRNVILSVTGEGLRIELVETEQGMFFVNGSPNPTDAGKRLLKLLSAEISRMPNAVVIEGHTDAHPFRDAAPSAAYGNWELSTERANAARRLLCSYGVRAGQVMEVRGFAERRPMDAANPGGVRNRRISLVVQFTLAGGGE